MKNIYLLPISLVLLNPGFANELESNLVTTPPTAVAQKEVPAAFPLASSPAAGEDGLAVEIDPGLLDEIHAEIASMLEKSSAKPEEEAFDFSEQTAALSTFEEMNKETAATEQLGEKQTDEQTSGSHVRRYETQPSGQSQTAKEKVAESAIQAPAFAPSPSFQSSPHVPPTSQNQVQAPAPAPAKAPEVKAQATLPAASEGKAQAQATVPAPAKAPEVKGQAQAPAPAKAPQAKTQAPKPGAAQNKAQAAAPSKTPQDKAAAPKTKAQAKAPAKKQEPVISQAPTQKQPQTTMQQAGTKNGMNYNTAVRPVVKNGLNLWVEGEALLWQAVEDNLTFVYSGNNKNGQRNRDLRDIDFDWDWGFRVGAGYNIPRDGWDIDLYWTHIRNTASEDKRSTSNTLLTQVWNVGAFPFNGSINFAKGHWQVNLEQVDLTLGREFFVGKHLTLRPFAGLRSDWIFQKYHVEVKGPEFLTAAPLEQEAKLTNRFWGFGFAGGFNTDWRLGGGFSIYGDADLSILMGFFDVDQKGTQNDLKIWSQNKSFRTAKAIADLGLGFKWFGKFCKDSFGLTFKAGYEYHLFFNQNQFVITNGNDSNELFTPLGGDLAFQGVTGSVQFDF
jgi:Legionella pneumophila major outer membrane protein precursor